MQWLKVKQIIHFVFATAFVLLLGMEQLRAATVNIDVNGNIVYESGVPGIVVGDLFTASGSYDDATVADSIMPTYSTYLFDPSFSVSLSAGSALYNYGNVKATVRDSADVSPLIGAPYTNYYPDLSSPLDMFVLSGSSDTLVGGIFAAEKVTITFFGTADLFSGTGLPTSPMDFLNNPEFLGVFVDVKNNEVNSLTIGEVSAVPVPAAIWLFASGLIALLGVSRKHQ